MKIARLFGLLLAVITLFVIVLCRYGWWVLHHPYNANCEPRIIEISSGESLESIRSNLVDEGILSPEATWVHWARLTGKDRFIKSGRYELSAAMSPVEILAIVVTGDVVLEQVTIPEGWIAENIYRRLSDILDLPVDHFTAAARNTTWLRRMNIPDAGIEGYLFPETYLFARGISAREILGEMIKLGQFQATAPRKERAAELGLSWHQILTLASIIEAETTEPKERSRVAAVYHNRLRRNSLMQADPTAAYAAGRMGKVLTLADLKVHSPYNTYIYKGLPPGPICSPGEEAIEAALYPLEGCLDFYFVARGDGSHIFSRTLSEHNQARRAVKRR